MKPPATCRAVAVGTLSTRLFASLCAVNLTRGISIPAHTRLLSGAIESTCGISALAQTRPLSCAVNLACGISISAQYTLPPALSLGRRWVLYPGTNASSLPCCQSDTWDLYPSTNVLSFLCYRSDMWDLYPGTNAPSLLCCQIQHVGSLSWQRRALPPVLSIGHVGSLS